MILFLSGLSDKDAERFGIAKSEDRIRSALNVPKNTFRTLHLFDQLPETVPEKVIIVGGSPRSILEDCEQREAAEAFMKRMVDQGKYVLGICYGMQLLSKALGGRVAKAPNPAHGIVKMDFHHQSEDPLLKGLPEEAYFSTYHNDAVIDLPENAKVLASNGHHKNQMVRLGDRVWGVQFHPEIDGPTIEAMIERVPPKTAPKWEAKGCPNIFGQKLLGNFLEYLRQEDVLQ